jgi:hypothetical protein
VHAEYDRYAAAVFDLNFTFRDQPSAQLCCGGSSKLVEDELKKRNRFFQESILCLGVTGGISFARIKSAISTPERPCQLQPPFGGPIPSQYIV